MPRGPRGEKRLPRTAMSRPPTELPATRPPQRELLRHRWEFCARKDQLPPDGEWRVWLYLAGRGSGKTRAGADRDR